MGTVPIIEFLIFDVDEKTAMITEIKFIKLFGRKDLGLGSLLNKTDGGDGTSGYRHTLDALRRISEASKICNQNRTLEHRQKLSQAHLGKKASVETRVKMSNSHIGMIFQDEHRKNLSAQYKQRTPLVCPHCQKSSVSNTMKRWHFNNCKNKEVA